MAIRKKLIRSQVEELLSQIEQNAPPVVLERVAEALNLEIRYQPDASDISGCLIRKDGRGIIGVNPSQHPNRRRFTIAHEIGHFILHKGAEIHLDRVPSFRVNFRDADSSTGMYQDEIEANFFAAELLMPARFLTNEFEAIDLSADDDTTMQNLASRYGVSVQALTYRLINLGLLPQS